MEGAEGTSYGVTVKGDEATDSYRVAARSENPALFVESTTAMTVVPPVSVSLPGTESRKKRGRPRKYGPDGKVANALSPMPISSSIPLTGEFSSWKRSKPQPFESLKKQHIFEYESPGERITFSVGANFTPHAITVNPGEDVMMKILSFSQQASRAICILSANGAISNVTLRQANTSGGTLTYEGRFEILSLTGSFMPTDNGGTKSRSGGMSVSLAGPDGRVVGGGLAGLLVAAGPVQVVVGSFLPGHQLEQKPKRQRSEHVAVVTPIFSNPISREERETPQGVQNPILTSSHGENWGPLNSVQGTTNPAITNNKSPLPSDESKEPSPPSNCNVSI